MTLTIPVLPRPRLSTIPCCPNCGTDLSLTFAGSPDGAQPPNDTTIALRAAQKEIDEMQSQIRLLNAKATAAVDRWADYEDELTKLRRELDASKKRDSAAAQATPSTPRINTPASPSSKSTASPGAGVSSFATAATNRISALLSRKSTPNLKAQQPGHQSSHSTSQLLPTPPPSGGQRGHQSSYSTSSLLPPRSPSPLSLSLSSGRTLSYDPAADGPPPSTDDLLDALTREQQMRVEAERQLDASSKEVEELSVTLFTQANEMVATERREKARLEERVGELERREGEKKRRLERLESAVGRIERVRDLLGEK